MGKPKQLLPLGGQSLIGHCVQTGLTSRCFPVVVVLGANAPLISLDIKDLPVFIAQNPNWEEGMASSIRTGVEMLLSVNSHAEATIVMLCDQPFVQPTLLNELIDTYHQTQKPIVSCSYGGILGVPALFSKYFFSHLQALQGQEGARKIIAGHQDLVQSLDFPLGSVDIDTPEDYLTLQLHSGGNSV
jgi:molybdenum cofactor cytidylyltransferase